MKITWFGQACFKIQSGNKTIIIDPYDAKVGFELPKCHTDIVLVTHGHFDHSNTAAFPDARHVVTKLGEYIFDDVAVKGISTYHDALQGQQRGLNTMYKLEIEGVTLLHMGDFGESKVRLETLTEIGQVDILMIPVGGTYTIDGAQAASIVKQIDPKIVIPMHYLTPGLNIPLAGPELFLESMGASAMHPLEQLDVVSESIAGKLHEVVVLSRSSR